MSKIISVLVTIIVVGICVAYVYSLVTVRECNSFSNLKQFGEKHCNCEGFYAYGGFSCMDCDTLCKYVEDVEGDKE